MDGSDGWTREVGEVEAIALVVAEQIDGQSRADSWSHTGSVELTTMGRRTGRGSGGKPREEVGERDEAVRGQRILK